MITGVIASALHVISGLDHLTTVTPIAIETKNQIWRIGVFWRLGHLAGILIIFILFLLFKEIVPVDKMSAYSEQIVSFVLIGVGI